MVSPVDELDELGVVGLVPGAVRAVVQKDGESVGGNGDFKRLANTVHGNKGQPPRLVQVFVLKGFTEPGEVLERLFSQFLLN